MVQVISLLARLNPYQTDGGMEEDSGIEGTTKYPSRRESHPQLSAAPTKHKVVVCQI